MLWLKRESAEGLKKEVRKEGLVSLLEGFGFCHPSASVVFLGLLWLVHFVSKFVHEHCNCGFDILHEKFVLVDDHGYFPF